MAEIAQRLVWRGAAEGAPAPAPALPRAQRRRAERALAREKGRTFERPLQLADVPPGSLLSDATLEAIATGQVALVEVRPAAVQRPSRKERARQARRDRLRQAY